MHFLKKLGITFLAILIVSSLTLSAFAVEFPFSGMVTGDYVNVRTGPSLNDSVLYTVNRGTSVDVYEQIGEWYKVGTSPTTYAYIYAAYVAERSAELTSRMAEITGGAKAVDLAKQFLGLPYVYGGTSPSGFDCSGLVYYVYKQLGYTLNRTAHGMLSNGVPVEKSQLIPGDIVMFKRAGSSYVHHVGIYVGDGMMIHSPQTGDVVKYTSIVSGNYNNVYYTARRIIR